MDVDPTTPLLYVLRNDLELNGPRFGCGLAQCGACAVLKDGVEIRSCVTPIESVGDAKLETIEHLQRSATGRALQEAWLELEVVQCGYCQSGQLMSATALLATHPAPSDADIDAAMSGNICRCGTYPRIKAAIKDAAAMMRA